MLSHKKCRQTAGQITVFLALCAGLVVTVIMAEIESARYSAVMSAQKTSAMLACSSMLAEYNIPLFDQYGIFGVDSTGRDLTDAMKQKVLRNTGGFFGADISDVCLTDLCALTDENYDPLKKEIVQYMKTAGYIDVLKNSINQAQERQIGNMQYNKEQISQKLKEDEVRSAKAKSTYEANQTDTGEKTQVSVKPVNPPADPRKTLNHLLRSGLLTIILPAEFQISDKKLEKPSGDSGYFSKNVDFTSVRSVTERLESVQFRLSDMIEEKGEDMIIYAYLQNKFKNALHMDHVLHDTKLDYEMEYVICGHLSDSANLLDTANRIALVRTVFNFAYLLTDGAKTASAHSLAASIAAALLMPWLETVIYSLILAAWAYGEAIMDLRALFRGAKIPLVKNASNWQLSLTGLTTMTADSTAGSSRDNYQSGLSYDDYLMILFMFSSQQKYLDRISDLMEANVAIEKGYEYFRMEDCYYGIGCIVEYKIIPLFSGFMVGQRQICQWSECY